MHKRLPIITALVGLSLFIIHSLGSIFDWYTIFPSFDKYTHFLGGVFVLCGLLLYITKRNRPYSRLGLIIAVIIVGLLWEGYEYLVQHYTGASLATLPDSLSDLLFDTLGAIAAAFFVPSTKKRYNTHNAGK